MAVETYRGLRVEVAARELSGRPVPGRAPRRLRLALYCLPAVGLLGLLLIAMVWTTVLAFWTDAGPGVGGLGLGNFVDILTDEASLWAVARSLLWVLIALALVVVGFWIALLTRRVRRTGGALLVVLVVPFGVSALVAGAAFRLIFDPTAERGTASALAEAFFGEAPVWLGTGLIWWVLVSAFAWTWLGFVVSLLRSGLDAIPPDLVDRARVEGSSWFQQLRTLTLPLLRPVTSIVVLALVVAAARLFDLIFIVAPEPMRDSVDVIAVHWWRSVTSSSDPGRPAALAVLLFVAVAAAALLGRRGLRQQRSLRPPTPGDRRRPQRSRLITRLLGIGVGVVVGVLWVFPLVVLVATALHTPADAGSVGWWQWGSAVPSLDSFVAVANAGMARSIAATALVAVAATLLVVGAAVPPALLLTWGTLPGWLSRALITLLVVLVVAPVQMYGLPLQDAFAALGMGGSRLALALVHAAAGLPFAVLILRTAFASTPGSPVADALFGQTSRRTAIRRVWSKVGAAVVAVAVMEFVLVWNDFIIGFLLSGPGSSPLTLLLWGEARQFATSAGTVSAAAIVSAVVPIAVLIWTWRRFVVPGLTGGVLR